MVETVRAVLGGVMADEIQVHRSSLSGELQPVFARAGRRTGSSPSRIHRGAHPRGFLDHPVRDDHRTVGRRRRASPEHAGRLNGRFTWHLAAAFGLACFGNDNRPRRPFGHDLATVEHDMDATAAHIQSPGRGVGIAGAPHPVVRPDARTTGRLA